MTKYSYVYRLRSISRPDQVYVGLTDDLTARLRKHNEGGVLHTATFKPWAIDLAIAFCTRQKQPPLKLT